MGINFQLHRASVNAAKGIREFQRADNALAKGNDDTAVKHLNKGLEKFSTALDHLVKAEADTYAKAAKDFDQGNEQLEKAIEAWADGKDSVAVSHYENALMKYDEALDLLDN
ncbi:hypothetical protein G8770_19745 [Aestuariicella hydrocarbonica]|uniref:Uncharacterized protein n=1 Tax=Pseudomaricurvus hydrocarbonicus TaxID=1470433 RepID=A0A9E5MP60_9GAMM|nr:hypothetical protein [Aestuariicella hydrocarbonica]NHO67784.1 hypothetical protein [Aestuariicella hydrocarbonica]